MVSNNKNSHNIIDVNRVDEVSDEILDLLNKTILGTPGKLRYKQTALEQTLRSLKNLEFIQIKKRNRVLGTAGIVHRSVDKDNLPALYVRYLSVYNPFKSVRHKKVSENVSPRKNKIRAQIMSIFSEELDKPFKEKNQSGLYYAFVEKENIQSKRLCESFGFKAKRSVSTFLFSRFYPKKASNIREVDLDSGNEFKSNLSEFYDNHSLVFNDLEPIRGKLFCVTENGKMIAGLRAFTVKWKLVEVPGISGLLMQKVLPYVPIFNKMFNSEYFQFLAFDHIWYTNQNQKLSETLMEHACADFNINVGLTWQDTMSELSSYLSKRANLGFLHKVNGIVHADLMIREINNSKNDNTDFLSKPIFISAVDMT